MTAPTQRLVEVPALGRLHAGRAAVAAGALGDQPVGVGGQRLELAKALAGDAHAAGVAAGGAVGVVAITLTVNEPANEKFVQPDFDDA